MTAIAEATAPTDKELDVQPSSPPDCDQLASEIGGLVDGFQLVTDGNSASRGYYRLGESWLMRCVWGESGDGLVDVRGTLGPPSGGYAETLTDDEAYASEYNLRVERLDDGHALITSGGPRYFGIAVTTPAVQRMTVKVSCGEPTCRFNVQRAVEVAQAAIRLGAGL